MRILHLSMLYPPHIVGGAEKSVALLCEALQAAGHDVAACCTTPHLSFTEVVNGISVYRMAHGTDFWAEDWPKHNSFERLKRKAKLPFSNSIRSSFERVLLDYRPDIVHTHSLTDVSTQVWVAAADLGLPIVHTLRDFDLLCTNSSMFNDGQVCVRRHLKCQVLTAAKIAHHRHVRAVVGVGKGILDTHLKHGYFEHVPNELRRVIWNPAALDAPVVRDIDADPCRPFTFGYLGRINEEKGVGTLLRACRRLPEHGWELKIAGKSPLADEPLVRQADGLPVRFLGFISAASFFSEIDVLIVPSIWPEPLGRTVLESFSAGVPVIGSRAGGIPDLIGHDNNDWLFEPDNDSVLAARMLRVLDGGRAALPASSAFQAVLDETTAESVVAKYSELYRVVLNG